MTKMKFVVLAFGLLPARVWANDYADYNNEELRKPCEFQKQSLQRKQ
ncbi:hypothetical protein [Neisseria yangbaofengii]|nr:hypothetical protein [Neisseria yangbaofengii]